jgi:hypothetical protein
MNLKAPITAAVPMCSDITINMREKRGEGRGERGEGRGTHICKIII